MHRGFTLFECLLTVSILVIAAVAGAPAISNQYEHYRMISMAGELSQFINQARSEAVFHNKDLYIHVLPAAKATDTWELRLSDQADGEPEDAKNIRLIKGEGILLGYSDGGQRIRIWGRNGKPSSYGSLKFSYPNQADKVLHLKYSRVTGRLRICGEKGRSYGYNKC
jgi:type IV fimbrial biogenesis protein FimT